MEEVECYSSVGVDEVDCPSAGAEAEVEADFQSQYTLKDHLL